MAPREVTITTKDCLIHDITRSLKSHFFDTEPEIKEGGIHALNLQEISEKVYEDLFYSTPFSDIKIPENSDCFNRVVHLNPENFFKDASSVKIQNLYLNIRKLMIGGAESLFLCVSFPPYPIFIPLVILVIMNTFYSCLNIPLGRNHAMVIWTMWNHCDTESHHITLRQLKLFLKSECRTHDFPKIPEDSLKGILIDLAQMGCIKMNSDKEGFYLIERVILPCKILG